MYEMIIIHYTSCQQFQQCQQLQRGATSIFDGIFWPGPVMNGRPQSEKRLITTSPMCLVQCQNTNPTVIVSHKSDHFLPCHFVTVAMQSCIGFIRLPSISSSLPELSNVPEDVVTVMMN